MTSFLDEINARGPWDIALQLGLEARAQRHLGPCPACLQDQRSRTDRRPGAVFLVGKAGWKCSLCGAGGGAVQLAAYRVLGRLPPKGDPAWREFRADLASRGLCSAREDEVLQTPRPLKPILQLRPVGPPPRPVAAEVARVWHGCRPVSDDVEVAAWLRSRALDPVRIAELDLARALPHDLELPRWAGTKARDQWLPWSAGWRCVVQAVDEMGRPTSLRARWCQSSPAPAGAQKTAAAMAGPDSSRGLVLADELGRQVLERGSLPSWWPSDVPLRLVVVEGEPDWLTWALHVSRSDDAYSPAVIGLYSGSWTDGIAARMPYGCQLEVRTHADKAGSYYQKRIVESCGPRCRVLVRRAA